jgi:hypothetical protein
LDYNILKTYKIINLLNCLGKILKKIIVRIVFLSEIYNILNLKQINNKRLKSIINIILFLINNIKIAKSEKFLTSILFLNIKKNFNNISKTKLINILKNMELLI